MRQSCRGTVNGYTSEGDGVVRLDRMAVFVPGAVRGEEIEFQITKTMKSAAVGEMTRVIQPSPFRREPDCPYFGRCGGCDFRHMDYEEELRAKRQRVQDALERIGGVDVEVEEIARPPLAENARPSGNENSPETARPLRYRNKSQFPVGSDGSIGFYQARSHRVVPVTDCRLQPEAANRTAAAVRAWMRRYQVSAYDERSGKGLVRHIYVRVNRDGESLCCIIANGKRLPREPELVGLVREAVPETVGVVLNANTRRDNVILGEKYRTLWGQAYLLDSLRVPGVGRELAFRLSVPSFYQVNREQAEILYDHVLDFAAPRGTETVLDLYCGIGTLTLCLAQRVGRVVGAEIVPQAVADAKENAKRNGVENAEFVCADAGEIAEQWARENRRPDVITVDPPRKGLTAEGVAAIAAMNPARVVYVSCDPGTLGRDVRRFAEQGCHALRALAVDLFPGTRHVESVVLLERNVAAYPGAKTGQSGFL